MKTAKLFMNGRSQAVRLPREFRFEGTEVYIKRVGAGVMLIPKGDQWDWIELAQTMATPDFMSVRDQGNLPLDEEVSFD